MYDETYIKTPHYTHAPRHHVRPDGEMNECDQGKYMDLGVTTASQDEVEIGVSHHVPESEPAWIRPSSSTNSLLGLPEMALQPSISSEVELLDDFAERLQSRKEKRKTRDIEQEDAQSEADASRLCKGAVMEHNCSKGQSADHIRRNRTTEVHNISERRRRDKIKGKIQALQELMPHCGKKDQASILEDAANYVKSLKLQVETMIKTREGEFLAQYMPCVTSPSMQFSCVPQPVPIRPGIGAGVGMALRPSVCANCSTSCAQWMPFPLAAGVHPFAPSMLASFPFPTMCPTAALPTDETLLVKQSSLRQVPNLVEAQPKKTTANSPFH